jgi:hypothetical protein
MAPSGSLFNVPYVAYLLQSAFFVRDRIRLVERAMISP